jgi:hypothetical protein
VGADENERVSVGATTCQLELGDKTRSQLEELLVNAHAAVRSPGQRVAWIAERLLNTPFEYESRLPIPPPEHMRLRLASLDCMTFVYTVIALAAATSVEDAITRLKSLRYRAEPIDSDPELGNIFDFAEESLLVNAVKLGYLTDVTMEIGGHDGTEEVTASLTATARHFAHDPRRRLATPKLGNDPLRVRSLRAPLLARLAAPWIQDGDIVLLRRATTSPSVLVHHLVIASVRADGMTGFIHATRSFRCYPDPDPARPPSHTGIFYDLDRRREQMGVSFGTQHVGDHVAFERDSLPYHGYTAEPRALSDYAPANFGGAFVLRAVQ